MVCVTRMIVKLKREETVMQTGTQRGNIILKRGERLERPPKNEKHLAEIQHEKEDV